MTPHWAPITPKDTYCSPMIPMTFSKPNDLHWLPLTSTEPPKPLLRYKDLYWTPNGSHCVPLTFIEPTEFFWCPLSSNDTHGPPLIPNDPHPPQRTSIDIYWAPHTLTLMSLSLSLMEPSLSLTDFTES